MARDDIAAFIRQRVGQALRPSAAPQIIEPVTELLTEPPSLDAQGLAAGMLSRADAARDSGDFRGAAFLYDEALRLTPDNAGAHVQCGHMFKETADLARAEAHYLAALRLTPDDADLSLQLGHFYKTAGRLKQSAAAYGRAAALMPGWTEPALELERLQAAGWRADRSELSPVQVDLVGPHKADPYPGLDAEARALPPGAQLDRLAPELVPTPAEDLLQAHGDGVILSACGRLEPSRWGSTPTLRGVQALRGFCNSARPLTLLTVSLNGFPMHAEPIGRGFALDYDMPGSPVRKYVFNAWCDFSPFVRGRSSLQLRFSGPNAPTQTLEFDIVIADPRPEAEFSDCDAVVTLPEADPRTVEEQINARPSVVRPAARRVFSAPIRNVLILRTDQLGDMVASIPAMERLRALLPQARLVGLLTSSNVDFAATLGVFDEIIPLSFPDDYFQRRRIMPLAAQEELRRRLEPYGFDLAIDLAAAPVSRPLLRLSGATYLCGFDDRTFPWLTLGFTAATHDPANGREMAAHSNTVLAFVERIGALLDTRAKVVRRPELTRERLDAYGLAPHDRFAVLHTGARIAFNRWPHYFRLTDLILKNTDLSVVLLTEEPAMRAETPPGLARDPRFQLLDKKLPFDDFDALLSFCTVFVGNDSGPKHLASLRGSSVVSIHSARTNWNDWGQELTGSIISRKVPCAGCQIYYEQDECGKDAVCITRITPEEVFEEAARFI